MILLNFIFVISSFLHSDNKISTTDNNDTLKYTKEERKEIRKCNTAKFAFFYMGKQSREYIKLMNLCRNDGPLFVKYVHYKYGKEYSSKKLIRHFKVYKEIEKRPYLRPSIALQFTAMFHAIVSGFSGYEGHRWLDFRLYLFLNTNILFGKGLRGENCDYGNRKAIDCLVDLLGSLPHRDNILEKGYMRVGVASFYHTKYKFNQVSTFTGPKLMDIIFHQEDVNKTRSNLRKKKAK